MSASPSLRILQQEDDRERHANATRVRMRAETCRDLEQSYWIVREPAAARIWGRRAELFEQEAARLEAATS